MLTLGSLFDGIGGFPLAATQLGIKPVWASEIEPAPVSITKRHFPDMKHLGDITQINGAEIEPVDIITFGSPCQDLSVAGNRAGMKHEESGDDETTRSGLFVEAVRIVREMREATDGAYPTYIVWENVPGAFSSNGGRDFGRVLTEITEAYIPMPASGKWATAGMVRSTEITVGWRVLDAQYWGVPQRRKRIFLIGDFGTGSAAEILFEQESLLGYSPQCGEAGQGIAANAQGSAGAAGGCTARGFEGDIARTLTARYDSSPRVDRGQDLVFMSAGFCGNMESKAGNIGYEPELSPTLRAGQEMHVLYDITHANEVMRPCGDLSPTLQSRMGTGGNQVPVVHSIDCRNHSANPEISGTLQAKENGGQSLNYINPIMTSDGRSVTATLKARDCKGVEHLNETLSKTVLTNAVRRLTPTECARLQGFPDGWADFGVCDIPVFPNKLKRDLEKGVLRTGRTEQELLQTISDSAQYKAYGNSLAIPCAKRVLLAIKIARERRVHHEPQ